MRALVYCGPETAELRDLPSPAGKTGQVRVRVSHCGICGTDISIVRGRHPRATAPLVLGHEFSGLVIDAPEGSGLVPGDAVVCNPLISCGSCHPCRNGAPHICVRLRLIGIDHDGGLAEEVLVPAGMLHILPLGYDLALAALVEPVAVVLHSLERAGMRPGLRAVVIGAGPIGLLTALLLRDAGAGMILISDPDHGRLRLCQELGFEAAGAGSAEMAQQVLAATGGDGADIVFECAGAADAARIMTQLARPGGTICVTATHSTPPPVSLMEVNFKELQVIGSRVYTRTSFDLAIATIARIGKQLERVISHQIPLSRAGDVFPMLENRADRAAMKILVECGK